jgi:hypothetical protein
MIIAIDTETYENEGGSWKPVMFLEKSKSK